MSDIERSQRRASPPQAQAPTGEWLYKSGSLVFGPIPSDALLGMLERGELPADVLVAREGGEFTPVGDVTFFMTVAAKASARSKVEEEERAEQRVLRRARLLKGLTVAVGVALLVGGAAGAALWAVRAGLFHPSLEELAQVEILNSPPLVAAAAQELVDELEYLAEGPSAAPAKRGSRGRSPPSSAAPVAAPSGGASFDQGSIQQLVRTNQNSLHRCLREHVAREPGFRGEVPITFAIGNDGRVAQLWIDRPGLKGGPLQRCMEAQLRSWRFSPFDGERPSVSLSFRVGG